jgi:hypothetical protein
MGTTLSSDPAADSCFERISTHRHLLLSPNDLVLRYQRAIRTYLGALLQNDPDADDVAQSFVQDMLQGKLTRWDPARGRFRDYLKKAVRNAALAFLRKKRHHANTAPEAASLASYETPETVWIAGCRSSLLRGALAVLQEYQEQHPGNVFYTVLQLKARHPKERSDQLAARLSEKTGRPFTPENARKQLERARHWFAELLLFQVKCSLSNPTQHQVQEELVDLGLLDYVRDFLPPG